MLINFSFENYKSFKSAQSFTMKREDESPYDTSVWRMPGVSPIAVIYGPNASGKSNAIEALWYVSRLVEDSFRLGDSKSGLERHPHLLDPECLNAESTFLVEFIANDGYRYVYWFVVGDGRIEYERLDVYRSKQPTNLFRRTHEKDGVKVVFGPSFKGPKAQMEKMTRPNALFIAVAAACGSEAVSFAHEFLTDSLHYYDAPGYRSEVPRIVSHFEMVDERSRQLKSLVCYADFGIEDMEKKDREVDEREQSLIRGVARLIHDIPDEAIDEIIGSRGKELAFRHRGAKGACWMGEEDQSDGTIAALAFFNVVLDALQTGGVALVDEIEKSLHPTIVREIVDLFRDPATNPRQAQLIFTTHDTSLINEPGKASKLIQRDQIWLVEKDVKGASQLLPLTAYRVREQDNFGRNYLNGVYGAIPKPSFHAVVAGIMGASQE